MLKKQLVTCLSKLSKKLTTPVPNELPGNYRRKKEKSKQTNKSPDGTGYRHGRMILLQIHFTDENPSK